MLLKSVNPYTGDVIGEFGELTEKQTAELLKLSETAFSHWREIPIELRGNLFAKMALLLREKIRDYALTITAEMGKPFNESKLEIEKCAWTCDYYAGNSAAFLAPEIIATDADSSYVSYEPLGPVLGIMPWNFPFWQVFRFAVPAMMAGNTVLLKHASNVQICARKIEELFSEAGFPDNTFTNLVIGSGKVEQVIMNEIIRGVSITGSEAAGRKVAGSAGRSLKKSLLELGGSNAFIVLADANLGKAAESGVRARFQNAGQSCIAAKRFILDKKISAGFIDLFLTELGKLKTGDPSDPRTDLGPLAGIDQALLLEYQVKKSVEMGARVISGGHRDNAFFQPTLVVDVRPGMPLFDEEVFGPVAPFTIAGNANEAVELANRSDYGLGVTLFTGDIANAERIARKFPDGAVFINGIVKSDPRLPFGGTKNSGYGRELSVHGIREFVNIKTVWIKNP